MCVLFIDIFSGTICIIYIHYDGDSLNQNSNNKIKITKLKKIKSEYSRTAYIQTKEKKHVITIETCIFIHISDYCIYL